MQTINHDTTTGRESARDAVVRLIRRLEKAVERLEHVENRLDRGRRPYGDGWRP
jgi:hypothetical protein